MLDKLNYIFIHKLITGDQATTGKEGVSVSNSSALRLATR